MSTNDQRSKRNNASTAAGLIFFSNATLEAMDEALERLLVESKAKCAVVIDRTGCILSSAGDFFPFAEDTMGAIAAGVVAALNQMVARATSPEVSIKFFGSDIDKIHFMLIDDRLILCLLHSRHTTGGQIRVAAKAFSQTVLPILQKDKGPDQSDGQDLAKSVQFIESKLNDMFRDFL